MYPTRGTNKAECDLFWFFVRKIAKERPMLVVKKAFVKKGGPE